MTGRDEAPHGPHEHSAHGHEHAGDGQDACKRHAEHGKACHAHEHGTHAHAECISASGQADRLTSGTHAHAECMHEHMHQEERPSSGTLLTVRPSSGLSGDMILAGLAGLAGLEDRELDLLVSELRLPALTACLRVQPAFVRHVAGLRCRIDLPHEHAHRNLADIEAIIASSAMPEDAKELSIRAFTLLAEAEAAVHGKKPREVRFHEVGALDSILDTCMACRIFVLLAPTRFVCAPLPLADGVVHCAHGKMPSPAPAVLRLLEGVPVRGFTGEGETVTPTALSLIKALHAEFGGWPAMTVQKTVISYGTKEFEHAPNGAIWALGS